MQTLQGKLAQHKRLLALEMSTRDILIALMAGIVIYTPLGFVFIVSIVENDRLDGSGAYELALAIVCFVYLCNIVAFVYVFFIHRRSLKNLEELEYLIDLDYIVRNQTIAQQETNQTVTSVQETKLQSTSTQTVDEEDLDSTVPDSEESDTEQIPVAPERVSNNIRQLQSILRNQTDFNPIRASDLSVYEKATEDYIQNRQV